MRSSLAVLTAATLAIFAALVPAAASAATEFGDTCAGDEGTGPGTLTTLSAPPSTLPLTAPTSGVITKVKMQIGIPVPFVIPEQVKVLRSAGGNDFTAVAEASIEVSAGSNEAGVRMPVQTGDRLGLHGLPFTVGEATSPGVEIYCKNQPGSVIGGAPGDVPVGATATFAPGPEARIPLAAVIESDADNDGFGDETQDACPQSAAVQAPCPLTVLDAVPRVGAKAVTVLVSADHEGPVSVTGTVKLGKGKKATLKAGPKTVFPGRIASFRLTLGKKVAKRLDELEPSKKLTLKITAGATNIAGQVSTDQAKVKLKGRA